MQPFISLALITLLAISTNGLAVTSSRALQTGSYLESDDARLSVTAEPRDVSSILAPGPVNTGGFATFFNQNGQVGACGQINPDSALISAISIDRFGTFPSPLCGKKIEVTNVNNGKTVTVTIADECVTCPNSNSMDLSIGAFDSIALRQDGQIPIAWRFL
ncbi:RlpA-like double-psi beta-barrel-protein domain-containing protein-containing protein [Cristinia sonorae]|uniref:RlpA-like double-psi beta-barrel-protein domain-containing protein-containing protein n=1 Tax=Cristinia sonorae TaxID=1940300 RepID=A0A8K0UKB1_9AGAR|nr:RlpA-like double-psi beta-barrel-protein domain-containing protein-containing protein [Cristinia sonorae]